MAKTIGNPNMKKRQLRKATAKLDALVLDCKTVYHCWICNEIFVVRPSSIIDPECPTCSQCLAEKDMEYALEHEAYLTSERLAK